MITKVLAHRLTMRSLALVALDATLILAALGAAMYLRLGSRTWVYLVIENGVLRALVVAAVVQASLYYADLYDLRAVSDRQVLFLRMVTALASASFVLAMLYYWFPDLIIGRGIVMITAVLVIALISAWRLAYDWLNRSVGPRERLLLVGTSAAAVGLARELFERRRELDIEIVGFIDPDPSRVGASLLNPGVIGTIEDIPSIVRARGVDRVVVSLSDARGKLPMDKLLEMKLSGVSFDHLATIYEAYTGKIAVENLRPSWLIFSPGFRKTRLLSASKRVLDITAAAIGMVLAAPLTLIIALAVRLTSTGPVLYHQARVGQHGRIFTIHKFRSMRADAEALTGPVWVNRENDTRITPLGGWLRRFRIDELPQLWNVLKGDMSFVGPRPERPNFVADLTRQIPFYGQRHIVRPGLTGWAQVRYTYAASVEDALQKLQYDLFYIKNLSIPFDVFIIFETIKTVLRSRGA